ncbi:hypothetical protein FRC09_008308 [Ceratobasidium sp. 395]|nr:hypothetical protein FRC09_008308 [Ceratobasidium sp. 395]
MAPIAVADQSPAVPRSEAPSKAQSRSLVVEQLTEVARAVLGQAVDLLQNTLSDDDQLTYQSKYIPGSTIGKHLRHARDHYVLLAQVRLAFHDESRIDIHPRRPPTVRDISGFVNGRQDLSEPLV